jgi:membrane associated rhomboid family serine protease
LFEALIPVSDEPKTRRFPFVNVGLILACVAVFIYELTLSTVPEGRSELDVFFRDYGVVPKELVDSIEDPSGIEEPGTVITSAFVHGGFLHLAGNMLYLWVFGDNIEDILGHFLYPLFYFAAAIGAVALQVAVDTDAIIPMVGASGAISGVMGGYFILYPTARVDVLVIFFLVPVPAILLIGFWFALQLLTGFATIGQAEGASEGVAVWAHVGGFITGLAIVLLMRPFIRVRPIGERPQRFGR